MPQPKKPGTNLVVGALATTAALLASASAQAASLQQVSSWGATGVPTTVSMYIYVPDNRATKPPILVLSHYCGGTASAVFGQAQSGGIVKAADQYGFIIIVPQTTNNCWDVGLTKSLTHDGGGETQAVAQMVKYALTKYSANADRVYATGDSSGAMMTEALLAIYPDVFKGGSSFAGVPAGCWAVGDPTGAWSNECAGGQVTHTPEEWGALARAMYPTYSGHRPRVQLFHGDADTIINFKNHTEAIKQWTNLLGLSTNPTSTDTVTLGSHQATRQRWQNSCGYVVLDAFTSKGGDHGPSDAILNASFVVPFLGLDKTDATDPEIAMCGAGGTGGAGGMAGAGGMGGAAGASGAAGNGGTATGGAGAMGGGAGAGGITSSGGAAGGGGANVGGAISMGGSVAMGGMPSSGGTVATGGNPPTSGSAGVLGGSGGSGGTGGTPSGAGGAVGSGTGGMPPPGGGSGALSGANSPTTPDAGGCACTVVAHKRSYAPWLALALGVVLVRRRRHTRPFA